MTTDSLDATCIYTLIIVLCNLNLFMKESRTFNPFDPAWHLVDAIQNEKRYFAFCRLLTRRISYGVFQEKEGGSKNGGHRYISNATDCDDRTQEREIHLFFFVFVQNARICQDRKG
jgi:hypothetical protein